MALNLEAFPLQKHSSLEAFSMRRERGERERVEGWSKLFNLVTNSMIIEITFVSCFFTPYVLFYLSF